MNKIKVAIGILAIIFAGIAVYFVLSSEHALLMRPKGIIARKELHLIGLNYFLMFIVIIPTFFLLFYTAWKYRAKNKAQFDPEHRHSEVILWVIPSIIIAVMTTMTWFDAHDLDPYVPIKSDVKPLKIQVVALDWKWLFIYPEQGIATLNYVQFPAATPIHFELSADGSPMNGFWVPELSGQIYAMAGMATQLHVMADEPGVFPGRAAEINGKGLADMTFVAVSSLQEDFDDWVDVVKMSPMKLNHAEYGKLFQPSLNSPVTYYSYVEKDLFMKIVMKYMHPWENSH